jgi:hypothetical protein
MTKVEIELSPEGFEHMWDNSMLWDEGDWASQDGRFIPMPDYKWDYAYFCEEYVNAVICMGYLKAIGEPASLHSDEAGGWLIVTNYASPCHLR